MCVCLKKKNTFVDRSRIYNIYIIYIYVCVRAHAATANGKRDVRWILCDIDLSLLFFSLDPLSSHSPPSTSSPPTKSLSLTSSLTHTHTQIPAMPPARRRLSFRPENCGKLYPFGVFRVVRHDWISVHMTSHYMKSCEHRMCVLYVVSIGCKFFITR